MTREMFREVECLRKTAYGTYFRSEVSRRRYFVCVLKQVGGSVQRAARRMSTDSQQRCEAFSSLFWEAARNGL